MADYRGIEYLRKKLNRKRSRVLRRYKFYEMKNIARDMGIATPPSLQWLQAVLGGMQRPWIRLRIGLNSEDSVTIILT